jgi:uncharacterized membrane protein YqgA involved in biofilm formation
MKEKLRKDFNWLKNIWIRIVISLAVGLFIGDNIGYVESNSATFGTSISQPNQEFNTIIISLVTFALLYFFILWLNTKDKE